MSTLGKTGTGADTNPRARARVAGLLYLLITIAAPFGELFVRGKIVVRGDAAGTAANIMANSSLYRLGGVADLVAFACDVALAVLFYELFKPVSRSVSLLAAFFRLMHAAVVSVATLIYFAPLIFLEGDRPLLGFSAEQLQGLTLAAIRLHGQGYNIGLFFFGIHCIFIGCLILKSTFLPRILGLLMSLAGLCYLTNSLASLLSPSLKAMIYPYILMPAGIAELSFMGWLIFVGLNVQKWKEQQTA